MKHSQTHIPFLIFAVAATLVVVVANAYMWHMVSISVVRAADAHGQVLSAQADKAGEQDIQELYQSTAAERAQLEGFFIPASDVVSFVEALEAVGPQSGSSVSLSAIGADSLDGAAPGTLGAAHAHLSALGSWSEVMHALSLAQALPYEVSISQVELDVSSAADPSGAAGGAAGADRRSWSLSFDIQAALIATSSSQN